jgi:hypothetical protein
MTYDAAVRFRDGNIPVLKLRADGGAAKARSARGQNQLGPFIDEVAVAKSGVSPKTLSDESRQEADPPGQPPPPLVANAYALGFILSTREWQRLDDDERYALVKLGATPTPSHNFKAALDELLRPIR